MGVCEYLLVSRRVTGCSVEGWRVSGGSCVIELQVYLGIEGKEDGGLQGCTGMMGYVFYLNLGGFLLRVEQEMLRRIQFT